MSNFGGSSIFAIAIVLPSNLIPHRRIETLFGDDHVVGILGGGGGDIDLHPLDLADERVCRAA